MSARVVLGPGRGDRVAKISFSTLILYGAGRRIERGDRTRRNWRIHDFRRVSAFLLLVGLQGCAADVFSRDIFVRVYTHDRGEPQMFVEWVLRTGSIRHRETAHVHVTRLHAADFSR